MNPVRLAVTAIATATALGLAACGGSSSTIASSPRSAASVPSPVAPSRVSGGVADRTHLLYVLEAVDPGIGTDEGHLIARSLDLCGHISAGDSEDSLEARATKSFANGSWAPSELEAQAIVGTVEAYAC